MKATRRIYMVALGAAGLVLVGSMAGAVAYATNNGPSTDPGNSWSQGLGGGMMGGGWNQTDSADSASVTIDQARQIAQEWVATNAQGGVLDAGVQMPMGYLFVVTQGDKVVAHVMVNDDTGKVYGVNAASFGSGMMGNGWSNGRGQMMGQGRRPSPTTLSLADAQGRADAWLVKNRPGATATAGAPRRMGYAFTVTEGGSAIGRLMVFDLSGQVVFHAYASTGGSA